MMLNDSACSPLVFKDIVNLSPENRAQEEQQKIFLFFSLLLIFSNLILEF